MDYFLTSQIQEAMQDVGIACTCELILDGVLRRFFISCDKPGSKNGWYVGFLGDFTTVLFGTWKNPGVSHKFCSRAESTLSGNDRKRYIEQFQLAQQKLAVSIGEKQEVCRQKAASIWTQSTSKGIEQNGYVVRKGIIPYIAKMSSRGDLIIPISNLNGEIQSLQFIQQNGTKKFLQDTKKKGNFCLVSEASYKLKDVELIVVCEGFATACSIHQATGYLVVTALDAGNIKSVSEVIRAEFPNLKIIIAADDDVNSEHNIGLKLGTEAAISVGGLLAVPVFLDHHGKSDFNDMHLEQGAEYVLRQIESAAKPYFSSSSDLINEDKQVEDLNCCNDSDIDANNPKKNSDEVPANICAEKNFPPIPFPLHVFPEYMQDLVEKFSRALQCQSGFMAMNFLTVISGAVGNSVIVSVKNSWKTAPFLWFGVIDNSGAGKTHPQEAAMGPLRNLQAREQARYDSDLAQYKFEKAIYEKCKEVCDPPSEPVPIYHYYTQSFTIESLIQIYRRSTRGIVIYVDELAGLLKSMGQYKSSNNSSDSEQLLSLFGGKALKSDRASKNGFCRESGAAIMGGIQPGIFSTVFGKKEEESGMLFRFIPMVMNSVPPLFSEDDLSQADEDEWTDIVEWMYSIPAEIDTETGFIQKNVLRLSDEGRKKFSEFHNELSVIQPFLPNRFRGYMAKLKDYCLKFITILHLLECYKNNNLSLTVDKAHVESAIELTRYFAGQALQLVNGASTNLSDPFHNSLSKAINSLKDSAEGGKILLSLIRDRVNEMLPPDMRFDATQNKRLVTLLKELGISVTKRSDNKTVAVI